MTVRTVMGWNLRQVMATHGMYQTSELVPLLAERGVHLSREHVYRLVARTPQRLNMEVLAALCDILDCEPNDLLVPTVVEDQTATLVLAGLNIMNAFPRPGVRALIETSGLKPGDVDAAALGFRVAPRVNAAGRASWPRGGPSASAPSWPPIPSGCRCTAATGPRAPAPAGTWCGSRR